LVGGQNRGRRRRRGAEVLHPRRAGATSRAAQTGQCSTDHILPAGVERPLRRGGGPTEPIWQWDGRRAAATLAPSVPPPSDTRWSYPLGVAVAAAVAPAPANRARPAAAKPRRTTRGCQGGRHSSSAQDAWRAAAWAAERSAANVCATEAQPDPKPHVCTRQCHPPLAMWHQRSLA